MKINSIVLSAGKGTRMKSELPKVVQKVLGYEMVNLVLKSLTDAGITNNYLVVGYKKEEVIKRIDEKFNFDYVEQNEQLGTGHAVMMAKDKLANEKGITIITCGDTPLVSTETFAGLIEAHKTSGNDLTVLTAKVDNPTGYGRIIRNAAGHVDAIVEQKDANAEEQAVNEINTGIFCFDNEKLFKYVDSITNDNVQEEYYLTDLVQIFNQAAEKVGAYITENHHETLGVNDLPALSEAARILKETINHKLMVEGVNILDPRTAYIGPNVTIGQGTIIEPNVTIMGATTIGTGNTIKSSTVIEEATIGNNNEIGPMARLRNNVVMADNCKIGNFVELKNCTLANSVKAAHLAYIGDATFGNNVNYSCGAITANYDGVNKHRTTVGDNVLVGSNATLVAPVVIGDNTFVAASTTVTQDIEADKLVIGRSRETIKDRK